MLPTNKEEITKLGWAQPDIILISGDAYIDSPFVGVAVIGNWLFSKGFKVAVISQPDILTDEIARLGEPKLFWGVSAGAMDSFVANYTSLNKFRNEDDLTPGGINNRRPDRACMVYTNLIRRHFKNTKPIILGGVEASLRRIVHYDLQDNALRRSILFDAKADIIIYGMGEKAALSLAEALRDEKDWKNIKGLCYISKTPLPNSLELPSFEECKSVPDKFFEAFSSFYQNERLQNPKTLIQKHADRYLIQNPKQPALTEQELDAIYDLDYTREVCPSCEKLGKVKQQETIKFSITTHRGCFGECGFCAITVHQGREVVSRSEKSILAEIEKISKLKDFKGNISDLGGPTANMFGSFCKRENEINSGEKKHLAGSCSNRRCLFPKMCANLNCGHDKQIELLKKAGKFCKRVFISSGVRYDMICQDKENGQNYLNELLNSHISGQMKIAPEHTDDKILNYMGKPSSAFLKQFLEMFNKARLTDAAHLKLFLTYYFIAAYPGCGEKEMRNLQSFIGKNLKIRPEQVQIFTPTPSTNATAMYYCQKDLDGNKLFVEKDRNKKQKQKRIICGC
ncbi:MAG: YgiQ family radical SAM protein [Endomicrobium sp.]|jgi:uncharacterized radical SAM protein YgiQ|nr:YgiQ family radical SAM protein [Endomicrobium sp.]